MLLYRSESTFSNALNLIRLIKKFSGMKKIKKNFGFGCMRLPMKRHWN